MSNKTKSGFAGALVVVVILGLQSVEHWTVIDAVLTGLRRNGPVGAFLADTLLSPLVPLTLAVAALYLVFEGCRGPKDPSLPASPTPIDKITTQTLSTGAVTQQVFLGAQPQPPPAPKEPESKPNIRCLGPATGRLRTGMSGYGFYEDTEEGLPDGVAGAWVCFRNESSVQKKVAAALNARASISFLDASGEEIGTGVSDACWLGDRRSINFYVEETHCVVVILLFKNGLLSCPNMRRVHAQWGEQFVTEPYDLKAVPMTIEVRLIRGNDLLLAPCVFDFSIVEGQPVLKHRPSK